MENNSAHLITYFLSRLPVGEYKLIVEEFNNDFKIVKMGDVQTKYFLRFLIGKIEPKEN